MKHKELLGEHTIIKKIIQVWSKCKHGNDISEHGKQYNEWTTQICFHLVAEIRVNRFLWMYCSSKLIYLLLMEK